MPAPSHCSDLREPWGGTKSSYPHPWRQCQTLFILHQWLVQAPEFSRQLYFSGTSFCGQVLSRAERTWGSAEVGFGRRRSAGEALSVPQPARWGQRNGSWYSMSQDLSLGTGMLKAGSGITQALPLNSCVAWRGHLPSLSPRTVKRAVAEVSCEDACESRIWHTLEMGWVGGTQLTF